VFKVFKECRVFKDLPMVLKELRVFRETQDLRVFRDTGFKVLKEDKEPQVLRELLVPREFKEFKVLLDLEHKAPKVLLGLVVVLQLISKNLHLTELGQNLLVSHG